jgi:hypothetical protein
MERWGVSSPVGKMEGRRGLRYEQTTRGARGCLMRVAGGQRRGTNGTERCAIVRVRERAPIVGPAKRERGCLVSGSGGDGRWAAMGQLLWGLTR